nr:hypothetical protein [Tanacetum cinerariifolium]
MELYMQGKDHGRMILNSVETSPMVWPNVNLEDGTTVRPKTYEELDEMEKLHNTCDLKAANIILQVYSPPPQSTPYGLPLHQQHYPPQSQSIFNHSQPSITQSAYPQMIMPQQPQQSQVELPQVESRLSVPTFIPGDDLIDCLNKSMAFIDLSGRGSGFQENSSRSRGNSTGQRKTVKCYNCQGFGHMARQCTMPKRKQDVAWFKEKVLLVQSQAEGKMLDEEELAFLVDLGIANGPKIARLIM